MCLKKEQLQPFSEVKINNNGIINCYMVAERISENLYKTIYYDSEINLGEYKEIVQQDNFILNDYKNYCGLHSFIHLKGARAEKEWIINNDKGTVIQRTYGIIKCSTHIDDVIAFGHFRALDNEMCLRTRKMFYSEVL